MNRLVKSLVTYSFDALLVERNFDVEVLQVIVWCLLARFLVLLVHGLSPATVHLVVLLSVLGLISTLHRCQLLLHALHLCGLIGGVLLLDGALLGFILLGLLLLALICAHPLLLLVLLLASLIVVVLIACAIARVVVAHCSQHKLNFPINQIITNSILTLKSQFQN